jgi:type VI secretion system protein ImpE
MSLQAAEQAVRDGSLDVAIRDLQDQVRRSPEKVELRVFLFQLLCVMGQWDRARAQLDVAAELDAGTLAMAQMYREAVRCEMLRAEVFAGKRSPVIFGEPDQWLALLIESLLVRDTPRAEQAESLRQRAFEDAPTSTGTLDGAPFEWIADADMRLGPVCEAVINGRYYWLPFARITRISSSPMAGKPSASSPRAIQGPNTMPTRRYVSRARPCGTRSRPTSSGARDSASSPPMPASMR